MSTHRRRYKRGFHGRFSGTKPATPILTPSNDPQRSVSPSDLPSAPENTTNADSEEHYADESIEWHADADSAGFNGDGFSSRQASKGLEASDGTDSDDTCVFYTDSANENEFSADDEWEDPELVEERAAESRQAMEQWEKELEDPSSQKRKKRGPYKVGGLALRTIQDRAKLAKACGNLAEEQKWIGLKQSRMISSKLTQTTLFQAFAKSHSPPIDISSDSDDEPPAKRQRLIVEDVKVSNAVSTAETESLEPGGRNLNSVDSLLPTSPSPTPPVLLSSDDSEDADEETHQAILTNNALQKLAKKNLKAAKEKGLPREVNLYASLVQFYQQRKNHNRMESAQIVSASQARGIHFNKSLRAHARYFEAHQTLRPSRSGLKTTLSGLLDDEGIMEEVKRWLRTITAGTITPKMLCDHVTTTILPSQGVTKTSLSLRQVQRWLPRLGFQRKAHMKGVYWDGHERKDVQKRRRGYIKELDELNRLCTQYLNPSEDNPTANMTAVPPTLGPGEREHVLIFHDEMAIHANDCQKQYWSRPDETVLRKKDQGRLMMVSEFITAATDTGRFSLSPDEWNNQLACPEAIRLAREARVIIYPSSKPGADEYWNMKQMIAQLERTICLAEHLLPQKVLVFIFDNSSAHNSMPADALHVSRMNVGPGGAQSSMHDTIIPSDNPKGLGGTPQCMQFPKNLPENDPHKLFEGKPKGIRRILEERGLVTVTRRPMKTDPSKTTTKVFNLIGVQIIGQCKKCKEERARKPALDINVPAPLEVEVASEEEEEDNERVDCCMTRMLSQQEDFKNQKSMLEQVITAAGHLCIFLPKFHCELNPIEYYWGWVKQRYRETCNGRFDASKKLLVESLDACPGEVIRRFIRRSQRYLSVYKLGATGPLADFAVRKYKSHRAVSQRELEEAEEVKKKKDEKVSNLKVK